MAGVSKLLDEQVVLLAQRTLKQVGNSVPLSRKLQAVIAASKHSITLVAKVYNISRTTLTAWIKHLKEGNLDRLSPAPNRRGKTRLRPEHRERLKQWIHQQPTLTIKALWLRLQQQMGIKISPSTCHREVVKMRLSYIRPRPQHYKRDPLKAQEFKKKYKPKAHSKPQKGILLG